MRWKTEKMSVSMKKAFVTCDKPLSCPIQPVFSEGFNPKLGIILLPKLKARGPHMMAETLVHTQSESG